MVLVLPTGGSQHSGAMNTPALASTASPVGQQSSELVAGPGLAPLLDVPRDHRQPPGGGDLLHDAVARVGDEQFTVGVHRYPGRLVEP